MEWKKNVTTAVVTENKEHKNKNLWGCGNGNIDATISEWCRK